MSKADWSWLNVDQVAMASADRARFELDKGLKAIDERLDVEITDDDGTRTVVLTANGESELFGVVHALVDAAPSIPRWRFVALRPAGDFNFEIESGGLRFGVSALTFQVIDHEVPPGHLAIRLLVPNPQLPEWSDIALQIIEVGLGEEAAARIAHIEIDKRKPDSEGVFSLESLPGYVARHTP